jgi:hypothetical protein
MLKVILVCFFLILFLSSNHVDAQQSPTNSSQLNKEQAEKNLKAAKSKKVFQLKRIETKDSAIIYGADKLRTHIVHINYSNRVRGRFLQFTYDESEVVFIGVLKGSKGNDNMIKKKNSSYYFHKGGLIYSKNPNANDDLAFLLAESKRLLLEGRNLLKTP